MPGNRFADQYVFKEVVRVRALTLISSGGAAADLRHTQNSRASVTNQSSCKRRRNPAPQRRQRAVTQQLPQGELSSACMRLPFSGRSYASEPAAQKALPRSDGALPLINSPPWTSETVHATFNLVTHFQSHGIFYRTQLHCFVPVQVRRAQPQHLRLSGNIQPQPQPRLSNERTTLETDCGASLKNFRRYFFRGEDPDPDLAAAALYAIQG